MSILGIFCSVDDFWQVFAPSWHRHLLTNGMRQRQRAGQMHPSEIMTILILFHLSGYRTFKTFYTQHVRLYWQHEFPHLLSYHRFVDLIPSVLIPLTAYLHTQMGQCTGLSFIDSTALAVCKNPRIASHRVFAGLAARGKTSVGWFYGFKLHLVVNAQGEILTFCLTPGNVPDRRPVLKLAKHLFGKLFADRGYISHCLTEELFLHHGLQLITKLRKNMMNRLLEETDKLLLRKRALIESVYGHLKQVCQIEHSRHRSSTNFLVHLVAGLAAYCHLPSKPSLGLFSFPLPPT